MLKMLARLGKPAADPVSPERYHVLMEVARLAYAMRDTFVADPDKADVPVEHMLDDTLIDDPRCPHRPQEAHARSSAPIPQPAGSDTVYFAIVDEQGTAVSFINSLYGDFGTGIVTAKTGVTFHNRGEGFVLDPKHPNCIAPRKRPLHTLVPAMAMRNGEAALAFGVMGAHFQPIGHVYVMSNLMDYGMDPQEAIDCPRVFFEGEEVRRRAIGAGRHGCRAEGAGPSRAAARAALGRRADRGHRPRQRRADRRLRRPQGWHGAGLLKRVQWSVVSVSEGDSRAVRVRIEGSVQGVGFRYWTERVATELGLAGWVRNRRDGSVEALFCGPAEDVAEMLERCRDGPQRSARHLRHDRGGGRRSARGLRGVADGVDWSSGQSSASARASAVVQPRLLPLLLTTHHLDHSLRSAARRRGAGRRGSARRLPRRAPPGRPCRPDR